MQDVQEDHLHQTLLDLKVKTSVLEVPQVEREKMTSRTMEMVNTYDDHIRNLTWGPVKAADQGSLPAIGEIKEGPTDHGIVKLNYEFSCLSPLFAELPISVIIVYCVPTAPSPAG